jgi:glutaredoxin
MIMSIVLYSTHCPKCKVLESKLKQKNINFEENNNVELMVQKGFTTAPVLEVDEKVYNFKEAVEWIKEQ